MNKEIICGMGRRNTSREDLLKISIGLITSVNYRIDLLFSEIKDFFLDKKSELIIRNAQKLYQDQANEAFFETQLLVNELYRDQIYEFFSLINSHYGLSYKNEKMIENEIQMNELENESERQNYAKKIKERNDEIIDLGIRRILINLINFEKHDMIQKGIYIKIPENLYIFENREILPIELILNMKYQFQKIKNSFRNFFLENYSILSYRENKSLIELWKNSDDDDFYFISNDSKLDELENQIVVPLEEIKPAEYKNYNLFSKIDEKIESKSNSENSQGERFDENKKNNIHITKKNFKQIMKITINELRVIFEDLDKIFINQIESFFENLFNNLNNQINLSRLFGSEIQKSLHRDNDKFIEDFLKEEVYRSLFYKIYYVFEKYLSSKMQNQSIEKNDLINELNLEKFYINLIKIKQIYEQNLPIENDKIDSFISSDFFGDILKNHIDFKNFIKSLEKKQIFSEIENKKENQITNTPNKSINLKGIIKYSAEKNDIIFV
jgi:hypothetical protein